MQAMTTPQRSAARTSSARIRTLPDPLPKPPGRPPGEPIIIKNPPRPPEAPDIDGSLDEEDEPEIKKPPEIVPEKPPPPAPWERADRLARNFRFTAMDGRTTVTHRRMGKHGRAEA